MLLLKMITSVIVILKMIYNFNSNSHSQNNNNISSLRDGLLIPFYLYKVFLLSNGECGEKFLNKHEYMVKIILKIILNIGIPHLEIPD